MPAPTQAAGQTALRIFAFEYCGTLVEKAEVRTKLIDGCDYAVPVVCMDLQLNNELRTPMHVEHPYPMGKRAEAEAAAATLKAGTHVCVKAPAMDMRLVARNATEVTPQPLPPAAPAAPTPNPQEPELWPQ